MQKQHTHDLQLDGEIKIEFLKRVTGVFQDLSLTYHTNHKHSTKTKVHINQN